MQFSKLKSLDFTQSHYTNIFKIIKSTLSHYTNIFKIIKSTLSHYTNIFKIIKSTLSHYTNIFKIIKSTQSHYTNIFNIVKFRLYTDTIIYQHFQKCLWYLPFLAYLNRTQYGVTTLKHLETKLKPKKKPEKKMSLRDDFSSEEKI